MQYIVVLLVSVFLLFGSTAFAVNVLPNREEDAVWALNLAQLAELGVTSVDGENITQEWLNKYALLLAILNCPEKAEKKNGIQFPRCF